MKKKKVFQTITAVLTATALLGASGIFAVSAQSTPAAGTCGEDLTWTYDSDTHELSITGTGDMEDYGWDFSWANGQNNYAFLTPWYEYRYDIEKVTIGNGVTSIGTSAFGSCSSMTSIEISDSVTSIGFFSFYQCNSLTSVVLPDSVTNIAENAFYECKGLTNVVIPDSVTDIGNFAFNGCSALESVEIPGSVKTIGDYAFRGCSSLSSAVIHEGVTRISGSAFRECSSLTNVVLPDSITFFGASVFQDCTGLTSVTIGGGTTSIGGGAFEGCSSLTSIVIPDNVTYIYDQAFKSCTGLTSVVIPESMTNISYQTFYGCTNLASVYIDSAEIAKQLTSATECGNLIENAETVYINTAIPEISKYILSKYISTGTVEYNGTTYTSYIKSESAEPDPTEPDPGEKVLPVLTITTDKDVYNFGDTLTVTVTITYPDGTTDAALEAFYADVYTEFRFAKASSNWWGNAFDGPIYDCDNEYGTTLTAVFTMDQYRYGEGEYVIGILQYYEGDNWDYDYDLLLEGSVNIYYTAQDETSKVITGSDLAIDGGDIVIDAKGKDSAVLDLDSVRKTLKDVLQSGDASTTLKISLSGTTVTLDSEAIKTLFEAAESGYRMTVTGKSIDKGDLNEDQLKALEGEDVAACISLEVWVTSWDYDIDDEVNTQFTDFGDGKVTVAIPFELPEGADAKDVKVAYVADDGTVTAMPTTYEDGALVFETTHFSNYVALVNSEIADPDDNDPTDPGDSDTTAPGKDNPANPDKDDPANPDKDDPANPDKDNPANPDKDDPANPGKDDPADPGKDDPTDPGKDDPADPANPDKGDVNSPKTGDNSYLFLWALLLIIGAAGVVVFVRKRGKAQEKDRSLI